ncbi:hypothetical protein PIB30_111273 [Stylosanthes scabra]|uniref:Uncharacterized protein n=1 Tax=Stylosanthes scabra TaxID=79078 RepID=A0ABU6Y2M4_9FABA|nr:hypothetical protein [Stylosanthes scabra]
MANEQMLSPYQDTARQFREMEMQRIPITMANLTIHREQANKGKGKAREMAPDSEDSEGTFVSIVQGEAWVSKSEEYFNA